jgi:hypothetical protein
VRSTTCIGPAAEVAVATALRKRSSNMLQSIARSRLLPISVAAAAAWSYANSESTVSVLSDRSDAFDIPLASARRKEAFSSAFGFIKHYLLL